MTAIRCELKMFSNEARPSTITKMMKTRHSS